MAPPATNQEESTSIMTWAILSSCLLLVGLSTAQYDPYNTNSNNDQYRPRPNNQLPFNNQQQPFNGGQYNPQYGAQNQWDRNGQPNQYGQNNQGGQNNPQFDQGNSQFGQGNPQSGERNQQSGQGSPQFGQGATQYGQPQSEKPYQGNPYYSANDKSGRDQYDRETVDVNDRFGGEDGNCCQDYCYRKDDEPHIHFGTKTAYQFVYGKKSNQHLIPQCRPVQFWSLNRHGTRFPGKSKIDKLKNLQNIKDQIIRNYEERRSFPDKGKLCNDDLDLFKRWRWNQTLEDPNFVNALTSQGQADLKYLARRYKSRFQLLTAPYSEQYYKFQYTNSDRTHDSYQAFIEGLFDNGAYNVHADVLPRDELLEAYKSCGAWQREVDDNLNTLSEYNKFREQKIYQDLVRHVYRRLGFKYNLNQSIVEDIYDMCRYEKAWYLDYPSAWCAAFTKEHLKILEYAEDLKYYYNDGYGHEMNAKLGCPPLKDMFQRFERTVNGAQSEPAVTVYFTHSTTIHLLLTAMGINKDYTPLTAANFYTQGRRQWRTSIMGPFGANLAAVLYQCSSGEPFRVMLFLNENPVDLPQCSVGLCSWQTFKEMVQNAVANCDLEFCKYGGAGSIRSSVTLFGISVLAVLLIKKILLF